MRLLPNVTPEMLLADFWLERVPAPDAPRLDAAAIAAYNTSVPDVIGVPPVLDLPDRIAADVVRAALPAFPDAPRYDADGALFSPSYWDTLRGVMALDALPDEITPRFGVAVRRTAVRDFPTDRIALKAPGDLPFDRFSETTIDVGWPVAVVHQSTNGWIFALTPHYWGWLHRADVALADRATVAEFVNAPSFAVAIAPWAELAVAGGGKPATIQMGTRLPLESSGALILPRRAPDGGLTFTQGYPLPDFPGGIPAWHTGYLPASPRALLDQAFKLLGEPYAWGGMRLGRPGRDCSRLTRDVWATTGILLPRNSGQQGRIGRTVATFPADEAPPDRAARLSASGAPADLLLLPGHVMLYLGTVEGRPYALHDLWQYRHPEGHLTTVQGVAVTDLPLQASAEGHTLLERLTHVQAVRPA